MIHYSEQFQKMAQLGRSLDPVTAMTLLAGASVTYRESRPRLSAAIDSASIMWYTYFELYGQGRDELKGKSFYDIADTLYPGYKAVLDKNDIEILSPSELRGQAGLFAGELSADENLRAAVCRGIEACDKLEELGLCDEDLESYKVIFE